MGNIITMIQKSALSYGKREVFRFRNIGEASYSSLSWNDLVVKYQNVSRALISLGFGCGDNIGIFSENRPEWVMTDLGIIANRSVVVPLYATSSKQQLKYIVDETLMKLMFVGNREQYDKAEFEMVSVILMEGIQKGNFQIKNVEATAITIVTILKGLEIPLFINTPPELLEDRINNLIEMLCFGLVKR